MMKKVFFAVMILLFIAPAANAADFSYKAGKIYCNIVNPMESIKPFRLSTCEEQHVIQQQSGGTNIDNIVWWSASEHVRTDLWSDKPWANNRPWFVLGFTGDNKDNLEKAYMLGTYGVSYSLFLHPYKGAGESSLIAAKFDGASNILYAWSFIINQPQKQINQLAYIVDKKHWRLLIDWVIGLAVAFIEVIVSILVGMLGAIIGTVFNPLDTLFAIPGAIILGVETIIPAFGQTAMGILRVIEALL